MTETDDTLTPTGRCYEFAAETVVWPHGKWRDKIPASAANVFLCHGFPSLTRPPFTEYGHAWVEFDVTVHEGFPPFTYVIDGNLGRVVPQPVYYCAGQIDAARVKRYTKEQAFKMLLEHEHYGPWEGQ